jgi:NADH-quinone oxidoreductase subunit M
VGPKVTSREIGLADALALVPLVLIILVLAFYPQFGLKRSQASVRAAVTPAAIESHIPGRTLRVASR